MASTSIWLHFNRNAEEAFNFYKAAFGSEFTGPITRMGDLPVNEGMPPIAEADKNLIMQIALSLPGGLLLNGNDVPEFMDPSKLVKGNNVSICLNPDTLAEAERIFAALSDGGNIEMPMMEVSEGEHFGTVTDKFGLDWMVQYTAA